MIDAVEALLNIVADTSDNRIPEIARACLAALGTQLRALKAQILEFGRSASGSAIPPPIDPSACISGTILT